MVVWYCNHIFCAARQARSPAGQPDSYVVHHKDDRESLSPASQELEATDHSQMNYEEFRKNFYVEVPELARITDAELADIHLSLDNMQVRGKNPPKPIKTWIQAGISMKILGK